VDCNLQEADFTQTDLTGSVFENCDMQLCRFENTILNKVDFSASYHFTINPEINYLSKTIFSKDGALGLLANYDLIFK
jgi:uncharacterized protein YjbI with pentapeptide repeats